MWQGIFDDMVEAKDNDDPDQSLKLRHSMKLFINKSLGVGDYLGLPEGFNDNPISRVFSVVANAVLSEYRAGQPNPW